MDYHAFIASLPSKPAYEAEENYPPPHEGRLFAVRFFNQQQHEIGCWFPDLHNGQRFDPPRVWDGQLKATLKFKGGAS